MAKIAKSKRERASHRPSTPPRTEKADSRRDAETQGRELRGELAEGWIEVAITDVCDLNPPKPAVDSVPSNSKVTFVPMPAVDADARAITNPQVRAFEEVRKGFTSFRDNDVIVAKITPCFENGKAAICRGLVNGLGFGSTEFHVLRADGAVLPEYVYRFVQQDSFLRDGEANMTGSVGQKRVPAVWLGSLRIPLPPLAEQRRIVAQVEALLARVQAARTRLGKGPALLKRFRQSVLAAACSGQLTADWREENVVVETAAQLLERIGSERRQAKAFGRSRRRTPDDDDVTSEILSVTWDLPESWAWGAIKDILHYDRSAAYGVLQPGDNEPCGVPFVRVCDLVNGGIEPANIKRISPAIDRQYPRTRLQGGEVLVTLVGTIGRTAVVSHAMAGANVARAVGMLPLCPHASPVFVRLALDQPVKNRELDDLAREVARKTLNLGLLKAVRIPLPPLPEQHEIVRRVEALFALADRIEARVTVAMTRVEKITQAILAKAFRGELVPTEAELARQEGRDYEPASVLLERIRAEREATASPPPKGPRRRRTQHT